MTRVRDSAGNWHDVPGEGASSGLATTGYVDDAVAAVEPPSLEGYATETYVDDAVAAVVAGARSLLPESDTSIEGASWGNSGNTNYDTAAALRIGSGTSTAFGVVGLMTFDMADMPADVASAVLHLCWTNPAADNALNSANRRIFVRKMLRAYVSAQANWNNFATGQAWGTAGAEGAADRSVEVFGVGQPPYVGTPGATATPIWWPIDITPLVREAVASSEPKLRLHMRFDHQADTNGSNPLTFASLEHATARFRPRLSIAGA